EFVRVCSAYGAGFFYIPGTDTCLRLSGRARFEYGYQAPLSRGQGNGDYSGYRGLARINIDARTQTGYGTLRAFLRIEAASRTGIPTLHSGTQIRTANAFPGTGIDQFGRVEQYFNTDKAFVQFAGLTAGRASSFFDFYAHDFEFIGGTSGSDVYSTNLLAYTATLGNGFSATLSMEDPSFRRTPIYSPTSAAGAAVGNTSTQIFGQANSLVPAVLGVDVNGKPIGFGFTDGIQRNRMPDFVGVLRYDQPWGSAQLSAAVHEINAGNVITQGGFLGTNSAGTGLNATNAVTARTQSEYGWAVQGGLKVNAPFIAPGDAFYLQGAYAEGAQMYTGNGSYNGAYAINPTSIQGASFNQNFSDATINPFTNQLQLSTSFSVVGSFLHYWSPEWRSAVFASYGENTFGAGARAAQGAYFGFTPAAGANIGSTALAALGPGTPGTRFYALNGALRDTYMLYAGANLIWSPVKDLDIGVEGMYAQYGVQNGRVLDTQKFNY
ncbi:porin, partial [Methylobacterium sp. J-076]|uniref:porin n=1 Tax=Methylobacterium sp. J-076 TaxID=2836655 RepID=UPI001FBBF3C1